MTIPGRPPNSQQNWIKIQEFRFDRDNETEWQLVGYLRASPKGRMRARVKALMLTGYEQRLKEAGKTPPTVDVKDQNKRGFIIKYRFDRSDPLERDVYEYLRRIKNNGRSVTPKMKELVVAGFLARSKPKTKQQNG